MVLRVQVAIQIIRAAYKNSRPTWDCILIDTKPQWGVHSPGPLGAGRSLSCAWRKSSRRQATHPPASGDAGETMEATLELTIAPAAPVLEARTISATLLTDEGESNYGCRDLRSLAAVCPIE